MAYFGTLQGSCLKFGGEPIQISEKFFKGWCITLLPEGSQNSYSVKMSLAEITNCISLVNMESFLA